VRLNATAAANVAPQLPLWTLSFEYNQRKVSDKDAAGVSCAEPCADATQLCLEIEHE
jgi:hypothetical protein